jgi:hypothetical protein
VRGLESSGFRQGQVAGFVHMVLDLQVPCNTKLDYLRNEHLLKKDSTVCSELCVNVCNMAWFCLCALALSTQTHEVPRLRMYGALSPLIIVNVM